MRIADEEDPSVPAGGSASAVKTDSDTSPSSALHRGDKRDVVCALVLALLQLALPILFGAFNGIQMNDGWAYARTAESLVRTGHLEFNGWGSPMLLPQIAFGALIIWLGGFSYAYLAWFGAICGAAVAGLLFLLARACGCSRFSACALAVLITINPIYLGVAPTFMTETFSLLLLLASLWFLVRSLRPVGVEGKVSRSTALPLRVIPDSRGLALATLFGLLAGSNRQLLWAAFLGALIGLAPFVPRREVFRKLLPAALAVVVIGGALVLWFNRQPYIVAPSYSDGLKMLQRTPIVALIWGFRALSLLGLLVMPFALAALLLRGRPVRYLLLGALLLFCLFPPIFLFREAGFDWMYRLTYYGQYFTDIGALVGGVPGFILRPVALPPPLPGVLTLMGALGMALGFYLLMEWGEDAATALRNGAAPSGGPDLIPLTERAALSAAAGSAIAQVLASMLWYMSGNVFDRYHLLIWPGLLLLHARQADLALLRRDRKTGEVPLAMPRYAIMALFSAMIVIFGITFAQEYFAYSNARGVLYRRLREKGVARTAIDGGFEFNADAQVLAEGHVNHPALKNPPGARDPSRFGTARFINDQFPAIIAEYRLSTEFPATVKETGLVDAEPIDRYTYFSLLPPNRRTMYVYRVQWNDELSITAEDPKHHPPGQ